MVRGRNRPHEKDGSGQAASGRARLLAQARAVELPDACTPSTWDGSGRPTEETGRSRVCRRQGIRREPIAAGEKTPNLGLEIRELAFQSLAARIEYDRPLGTQTIQLEPDGFPHAAADPISGDGFTQRARRGEADAWPERWVRFFGLLARAPFGQAEGREQRAREATTCVVNLSKIG
jgi:hypothetical protein